MDPLETILRFSFGAGLGEAPGGKGNLYTDPLLDLLEKAKCIPGPFARAWVSSCENFLEKKKIDD